MLAALDMDEFLGCLNDGISRLLPSTLFYTRSTQPCITPGSLNRVPASAGVKAGMSPPPGGR